eukprot:gnl/TRDRNA2_/TRDRNA2_131199_c0_seq4.p1 gnl/TRDRNA2_/TRDRNA2_131199_c0~~gnl/TRDRNA2_/TRDRNA2_131199_c0_seq4.p1  ORF type:complete len:198 (-),score=47.86 gnl/TRDRNA2_/TRDRNA2_131199_c0_seq4:184-777(-)
MLIHVLFLFFVSVSFGGSTWTMPTEPADDEASLLRIDTTAVGHQLARSQKEKTIYEDDSEELDDSQQAEILEAGEKTIDSEEVDDSRQADIDKAGEKTIDEEAGAEDSKEVDDSRQDEIDEAGEQDQQLEEIEQEALEQAKQDAIESQNALGDVFKDVMSVATNVMENLKEKKTDLAKDMMNIARDIGDYRKGGRES